MRFKYPVTILLVVATLALYFGALNNGFVNLDDGGYVTGNAVVQSGLSGQNVRWAFTTFEMANWHPLTWLSHMADCHLYALDARGHHLTSVLLHAANAALLFLVLCRMTASLPRSALVAALFALHPCHVESVAWISERKDVLSAFFFLVALFAYLKYLERPAVGRYLAVVAAFAAGLMAKPMLVTFPCVLLLLDLWPLGRLRPRPPAGDDAPGTTQGPFPSVPAGVKWILLEKVPFLLLSLASSLITVYAQQRGGAVASLQSVPVSYRLENALVAYASYLVKTVWPHPLVAIYPLPASFPPLTLVLSALLLGGGSVAVLARWRRAPELAVGWLWFLGMLVPVIGIMQVGSQAMGDRYTYLPQIGLFIMASWSVPKAAVARVSVRRALATAAFLALITYAALSVRQIGYWKESVTLYTHTLRHTEGNYLAHLYFGNALGDEGRLDAAEAQYRESLRLNPTLSNAHNNLGAALVRQGRWDEAAQAFRLGVQNAPADPELHFNLGVVLAGLGQKREAADHFAEALRLRPDFPAARERLERALKGATAPQGAAGVSR